MILRVFFCLTCPDSFRKECEYFHVLANGALELHDLKTYIFIRAALVVFGLI